MFLKNIVQTQIYTICYQYRRHSEAYWTAKFVALLQTPLHGTEQLNPETATKKMEYPRTHKEQPQPSPVTQQTTTPQL